MKKINIAIIGLGNIGSYLLNISIKIKKYFQKKTTVFQILLMLSAKNKNKKRGIKISKKILVEELFSMPQKKNIDLIVELLEDRRELLKN